MKHLAFRIASCCLMTLWLLILPSAGTIAAEPDLRFALFNTAGSDPNPTLPHYRPPNDSSWHARIGGVARGSDGDEPMLVALVPDHVGLTLKNDPSLCWHLSKTTTLPLSLTVLDSRGIKPVLETVLPGSARQGFRCLHLRDYRFTLKEREQYRWFITVTVDPEKPSRDIVAGGIIERIPFDEACALEFPCSWSVCEKEAVSQYAAVGLWYDAISCLIELIGTTPDDSTLHAMLRHLLQQAGLYLPTGV